MSYTSPAPTPSKSSNVERLLSLQKSSKHISDADILSFAAEASAMKRIAKASAISDENANPNSRSVSKRLFDIGQCSKSAMGSYSPEAQAAQNNNQNQNTIQEGNDSDADSDAEDEQEDTAVLAEKHVEHILQMVDRSASKAMQKREVKRTAARQQAAVTASHTSRHTVSSTVTFQYSVSDDQSSVFDSHDDGYPAAEEGEGSASASASVAGASVASAITATSTGTVTVEGIKDLVIAHILSILNTGTYEEILSLHGIGQVRAMRIVTARNAGHTFVSLQDLEEVGMNAKTVAKFLKSNAASIVS